MILLRHDVDTVWGLHKGVPIVTRIEEKYGVRSTFFVRVRILRDETDWKLLRELQDLGWEIGLHLDNTDGRESLPPPEVELNILREKGIVVHGATPHGSVIGWNNPQRNWLVLDNLRLKYIEGYGEPPPWVKTPVVKTHLSLDIYYIRRYGEKVGYKLFKKDLENRLRSDGYVSVLTHPEWFVRSVGVDGSGTYARIMRLIMTVVGVRKLTRVYEIFLSEYHDQCVRYIDWFNRYVKNI